MNEHEDQFPGQDDSEYHFSDDDVSFAIEPDDQKASAAPTDSPKEAALTSRSGAKRVLIILVVFIVLVFIVYKMVAGSSSAPPTDIAPIATTPAVNTAPVTHDKMAPSTIMPTVQTMPATIPVTTVPQSPPASVPQANTNQQAQTPQVMPSSNGPTPAVNLAPAQNTSIYPTQPMPDVMPVTGAQTNQSALQNTMAQNEAVLAAQQQRLMAQLQIDYTQRFNELANQNKTTQAGMQELAARVSAMENQLNEIYQTVKQPKKAVTPEATRAPEAPIARPAVKLPYSVQAIIPGRAWLKADNGDTVTVTEGDTIKDVGRVTKIDPYDGIVEINTGNTVVSVSYGTGG